ncbi:hypothetical protein B0H67DRAFT_560786 [Lasiosphaeris hirsuta]|uniref:Apple domain-containing protein n=1 Tax=Lasiosphaeris hirsuta TaxID=260670 RepID=A0AA40B9G2_9PEZI|nr:hypothetical protein B0H67DRAFT_560786 [Lasiosphaeris hirsuta]
MDLQRQGSTSQPPPLHRNNSRVRFAEDEPGLEVYHPPAAKPREKAPAESGPEVYWADDRENGENDANLSSYTFYREDTPTPPEYDDREKAVGYGAATAAVASRVAAASGQGQGHGHGHGNLSQFDTSGASNGSSGGSHDGHPRINRKRLWIIIAIVLLCVIVVAVGVGVGLGVGKTKRTSSDAPNADAASTSSVSTRANSTTAASSSTSALAGTLTVSTGPSLSSPAPQATITINSDCPAANNTIYSVPGSTKSFLRLCGLDYSGPDGATDLDHISTNSMAECMNSCASYDQCTGCAWGYIAGDISGTGAHRCWMKKELKSFHMANSDFCFAKLR